MCPHASLLLPLHVCPQLLHYFTTLLLNLLNACALTLVYFYRCMCVLIYFTTLLLNRQHLQDVVRPSSSPPCLPPLIYY
jgi:hypothetical protein